LTPSCAKIESRKYKKNEENGVRTLHRGKVANTRNAAPIRWRFSFIRLTG